MNEQRKEGAREGGGREAKKGEVQCREGGMDGWEDEIMNACIPVVVSSVLICAYPRTPCAPQQRLCWQPLQ